jgi:hypothetical protein
VLSATPRAPPEAGVVFVPRQGASARDSSRIQRELDMALSDMGPRSTWRCGEALRRPKRPAVGIALINDGKLDGTRPYSGGDSPRTLYQAASRPKLGTAAAALRLFRRVASILTETSIATSCHGKASSCRRC